MKEYYEIDADARMNEIPYYLALIREDFFLPDILVVWSMNLLKNSVNLSTEELFPASDAVMAES